MRTGWKGRVWGVAGAAAALLAVAGGRVQACQVCTTELVCVDAQVGGKFCLGSGDACLVAGRCGTRPGGGFFDEFAMVQVTLLDDVAGPVRGRAARVVREAGATGTGREAARIARMGTGLVGPEPNVFFSGVGAGEGVTVAFRSRSGDGFTLRRDAAGRGAHVVVRTLVHGRPGPLLASERLGERDALVARVVLDGRPRVLVLLAPTLRAAEARARERAARLALRGANGAQALSAEPPFELEAVDE